MVLVASMVLIDQTDVADGATDLVVEHLVALVALAAALATVSNPFVKKSVYLFANSKELSIFANKY